MSRVSIPRRMDAIMRILRPPGSIEYRLASLDPILRARYDAWAKSTEKAHAAFAASGKNAYAAMMDDPTAFPRMPKPLELSLWPEQRAVDAEIAQSNEHAAAGRTEAAEMAMARAYDLMLRGDE